MKIKRVLLEVFFGFGCLTAAAQIAPAQTVSVVADGMPFAIKDREGNALEPSAILALSEDLFLLADDKGPDLYVYSSKETKVLKTLKIGGFSIKKPKWEALAFDGKYFYVIGSHAVKPDDSREKLANRSHLLRFEMKSLGGPVQSLEIGSFSELNITGSLAKQKLYDPDPARNKVKIEGMAVRETAAGRKELVFALREPFQEMLVYYSELPVEPKDRESIDLKPMFKFDAGKIGVTEFKLSSIEYATALGGFLILTSTEDAKTEFHGNALWLVGDKSIQPSAASTSLTPQILHLWAVGMKAEGICLLPGSESDRLRLAVVFDNDFEDTRKDGSFQFFVLLKQ